jgi:CheY-like chemotaxis protein
MTTILIVDDESALRTNLRDMLEFEGFNILEAENGAQGVTLARQHRPDLVICDIAMPEIDGFELMAQLQDSVLTALIPVLLLTAQAEKTAIEHGLAAGAAGYIVKPFSFRDVLEEVRSHVGH